MLPLLPLTPSCSLSFPLTPSHSLSLPRPLWVPGTFLGPQKALGAFTSLLQPLTALSLQSYSGAVLSLLPLTPSLSLTPSCLHFTLSLPGSPWAPGTFLGPQKALGGFASLRQTLTVLGLQSDSGALLPLLPLTPSLSLAPSCPLSLPRPPWLPGTFLAPQALGVFASLQQPWVFSQTQGLASPHPPHFLLLPLAP